MYTGITVLPFSLAGFFFFPPVISSRRAVNFGLGFSNPRIKTRRKARIVATPRRLAAVILAALSVLGAGLAHGQAITITGAVDSPPFPAEGSTPGPLLSPQLDLSLELASGMRSAH